MFATTYAQKVVNLSSLAEHLLGANDITVVCKALAQVFSETWASITSWTAQSCICGRRYAPAIPFGPVPCACSSH